MIAKAESVGVKVALIDTDPITLGFQLQVATFELVRIALQPGTARPDTEKATIPGIAVVAVIVVGCR